MTESRRDQSCGPRPPRKSLISTSTTGTSYNFRDSLHKRWKKKRIALRFFLAQFFHRSLDETSSCVLGRSAVVTLRCNPVKSTKGDLSVPRYSPVCHSLRSPASYHMTNLFICVVDAGADLTACAFGHYSRCPAGTCDGCTFHFLWESSGACPTCTDRDYHQIEGACKGGQQVCDRYSISTGTDWIWDETMC